MSNYTLIRIYYKAKKLLGIKYFLYIANLLIGVYGRGGYLKSLAL